MVRLSALLIGACFAVAGCNAQQGSAPEVPAVPDAPVVAVDAQAEEGTIVANDFDGLLCRITRGEHVDAAESGNRSTSSSNGTTITVIGSKSQSLFSQNGKAAITVTRAAVIHLTFPDGELVSVETSSDVEKITVTIDGPDAISCKSEV